MGRDEMPAAGDALRERSPVETMTMPMPILSESESAVRAKARQWLVRLHAASVAERDRADFKHWCDADARHGQAYGEAARTWNLLGALGGSAADVEAELAGTQQTSVRRDRARRATALALAAGLGAIAIGLGWLTLPPGSVRALLADARTPPGEARNIVLMDGSRVHLNGGTAISWHVGDKGREVELIAGEAYFDIVHDESRPFVVVAGDVRLRDVGTRFNVERTDDRVTTTVEEGVVAASSRDAPDEVRVQASQQIVWHNGVRGAAAAAQVDEALAWRRGRMVFKSRRIGDVVEELARYRPGYIVVWDDAIRKRRVTGVFDAHDPDAVLQAIAQTLPVKVTRITPYLTIISSD